MNLSKEKTDLIHEYLRGMLEINKKVNLTRIDDFEMAKTFHVEDSLTAFWRFESIFSDSGLQDSRILDIGSGCGFPGVALGIASDIPTTLLDSVSKKMAAVQSVIDKLHLSVPIDTISARAEEFCKVSPRYSIVVARAVTTLPSLLELCVPFLQENAHIIVYKASLDKDEYDAGIGILGKLGLCLEDEQHFVLSDGKTNRTLMLFKRIDEPQVTLPRRVGVAQKRPLKP